MQDIAGRHSDPIASCLDQINLYLQLHHKPADMASSIQSASFNIQRHKVCIQHATTYIWQADFRLTLSDAADDLEMPCWFQIAPCASPGEK